ncbi:VCBS domain-containing protein [Pseudomonas nicosulfuronedens]
MSESYQWDFGSAESGLQFKVVYDDTGFTVTCLTGHMDLNALWFSDGDKNVEGTVTLSKADNSLNLNGTGVTWDDYFKVSSTGLGSAGENKASFLTAGESISFSESSLGLPDVIANLLENNPSQLTLGVRATSTSSLSGDGKYVDSSGTLISSVNHAPVLNTVNGATLTDTAGDDQFGDITGSLTGSDEDPSDTLSFELAGSSAASGSGVSAGFDVQQNTDYGTLYLNTSSGAYKFVAVDAAVEALKTSHTLEFTVNATDGKADSAAQTLKIVLDGVNDTPTLSATLTSHTYLDTDKDDSFTSVTGHLSTADRDANETATYAIDGTGVVLADVVFNGHSYTQKLVGTYGTLYLDASGAYEFAPHDASIEALEAHANEGFTLSVKDASGAISTATLNIGLDGAQDAPDVAPVTLSYTDTAADDSFADQSGTLAVTSRDNDTSFSFTLADSSASQLQGYDLQNSSSSYGTLYLNSSSGDYRFVANDAAIEALGSGNNPSLVYGVTAAADGVTSPSQNITIDITGANDAPRDLALAANTSFANNNGIPGSGSVIGTLSVPEGADPDGGGAYTYSLQGYTVGDLGLNNQAAEANSKLAVSNNPNVPGSASLSATADLGQGKVYEATVQVSQGSGDSLATYNETFSIVTGTNANTESIPGGGYNFSGGDDVIYGRQNIDIILAGSGNDTVFGQEGNDEIHGGTGIDLLYGGKDNDSFVFSSGDTGITLATADTIGDFSSANDTIVTSLAAGNVTIAEGSTLSDFAAFVSAANASMAPGAGTNDAYMAWNAAGSGDGWLVIDENDSGSVDAGDSLIVLVGVNTAGEFNSSDIA